jgi:hypothetical protein
VPLREIGIYEAAGLERERAPVDRVGDSLRERGSQLRRGILRIREDVLEERGVRAHGSALSTDARVAD